MLFNSFEFFIFLIIVWLLYYLPWIRKWQVLLLVAASFIFYAWENPWYLLLLLFSAGINIFFSYRVVHTNVLSLRKRYAVAGVALNLLILAFFKYSSLLSKSFFNPASDMGAFLLNIPLPIGISFFSFEGISLVVDVYKEKKNHELKSIVPASILKHGQNVLLFITFFPHLIAGPILKAHDYIPQINEKSIRQINWEYCFRHLVIGFFLKMVIADNLKDYTFWLQYPYFEGHSSFVLCMLLFGYSMQIFADFAGYSLIALGLAGLFGYRLEENFNFPYISQSFSEFWRRWHISLSSFLKEYLYIPLGGNRKGNVRTYLNLMITMFLGGLWHGAAWSYALWGSFHGAALAAERFLQVGVKLPDWKIIRALRMLLVFSFVSFAWLFFKLPEFKDVVLYVKAFFINTQEPTDSTLVFYILLYSAPVVLFHLLYLGRNSGWYYLAVKKPAYIWYGLLLFLLLTNSGSSGSFIYFQF